MSKVVCVGNKGPDVRSDCWVSFEPRTEGGLQLNVKSKVDTLFGDEIRRMCQDVLAFYGVEHGVLEMEDAGALDFTMAARLEAAIRPAIGSDREYLLPMIPEATYDSPRERYRRSRLYLPGNQPKFMINAGIHRPDGIILDLEDSVAPDTKAEARIHVRNALRGLDFFGVERMVRINQIPMGLTDLDHLIPHNVHLLLVPKCESADQIHQLEARIAAIRQERNLPEKPIYLMPIVESALGVIRAFEIASASRNVVALAIGLEDYTADLGTQRTREGRETFLARCTIVNAARAAGIQPIDSVFSDISDMEALRQNVLESKALGFDGMGCIHPRQIDVIHDAFAPEDKEIARAQAIVKAFEDATARGLGAVALGSKMIDPPVVKRALRTIDMALRAGKLAENWREQ